MNKKLIDMGKSIKVLLFIAVISYLTWGCKKENQQYNQLPARTGRIIINNNLASLKTRVVYYVDNDIPLNGSSAKKGFSSLTGNEDVNGSGFSIKLRAGVEPLEYNGFRLRATSVRIAGDYSYVSYNTEGDTYLGGVEVIDTRDKSHPVVISQAIFTDTDISSLWIDDDKLYLAEACEPSEDNGFRSPACMEVMTLGSGILSDNTVRVDLESFTATDVVVHNNKVFVTTGSTGGLYVLDKNSLKITDFYTIDDARSIDADNNYVAVLKGTPGTVFLFRSADMSLVKSIVTGGATIPESKSVVRVSSGFLYTALNDEGMKVIKVADGSVIASQLPPSVPEGAEPGDYVTNGVSLSCKSGLNLVLTANGAGGVWIHEMTWNLKLQLIGVMDFNSSTNFVESGGQMIYVATGFGGLKIIELLDSEPSCLNNFIKNKDYKWPEPGENEIACLRG